MAAEKSGSQMAHIPPSSLRSLPTRISYLSSFLSFQPSDGLSIQASKPLIVPLIPVALDLVYTKLLGYDITAKAFVPRQSGQESGPSPTRPQDLSLTHEHILHRKNFLKGYLVKLVSNQDWTPTSSLWDYMDKVGIAHTGEPGFAHRAKKPGLRVEFMQLALLLGFVEDVVVGLVLEMEGLDLKTKKDVVLAWNKLLWIQNDLFARHYVVDQDTGEVPRGVWKNTSRRGTALVAGAVGVAVGVASGIAYGAFL